MKLKSLLVSFLCLSAQAIAALEFSPNEVDMGKVPQRTVTEVEVKLKNTGSDTVQITDVVADCGCTAAVPGQRTLASGAETTLKVKVDSQNFSGPLTRTVTVITNSGRSQLPIKLTVNPFGNWTIAPAALLFQPAPQSEEQTQRVVITAPKDGLVLQVSSPDPWLKVTALSPTQVDVTRTKDAPAANLSSRLIVAVMEGGTKKELIVPVIAQVKALLTVIPNPIALGTMRLGEDKKALFSIEGDDGGLTFTVPNGKVTKLAAQPSPTRTSYEVTYTPNTVGLVESEIQIERDKQVVATIPLFVRVLPSAQ